MQNWEREFMQWGVFRVHQGHGRGGLTAALAVAQQGHAEVVITSYDTFR